MFRVVVLLAVLACVVNAFAPVSRRVSSTSISMAEKVASILPIMFVLQSIWWMDKIFIDINLESHISTLWRLSLSCLLLTVVVLTFVSVSSIEYALFTFIIVLNYWSNTDLIQIALLQSKALPFMPQPAALVGYAGDVGKYFKEFFA